MTALEVAASAVLAAFSFVLVLVKAPRIRSPIDPYEVVALGFFLVGAVLLARHSFVVPSLP